MSNEKSHVARTGVPPWVLGVLAGVVFGLGHLVIGWFYTLPVVALAATWAWLRLGRKGLGGLLVGVGTIWALLYVPGVIRGCGGDPGSVSVGAGLPVVATCSLDPTRVVWAAVAILLVVVGLMLALWPGKQLKASAG